MKTLQFALIIFVAVFSIRVVAHANILSTRIELSPSVPSTDDSIQVTVTIVLPVPCFKVKFSDLRAADHNFQAFAEIIPPKPGTLCIQVLGKFSHTYSLGQLELGAYHFDLGVCERDPIEHLCVFTPVDRLDFNVLSPTNVVHAGYDLFETDPRSTQFSFTDEFTIPAGFFDIGSNPFRGTVRFYGNPLGSFLEKNTGTANLIVHRPESIGFPRVPGSATMPVELAALSLASIDPIKVRVGSKIQQWNVSAEISPTQPSAGTMTLTKRAPNGGFFSSEVTFFPLFVFVRRDDGAKKILDLGAMNLSISSLRKLILRASHGSWVNTCPDGVLLVPDLNDHFCASASASQRLRTKEQARIAMLGVLPAQPLIVESMPASLSMSAINQSNEVASVEIELFTLSGTRALTPSPSGSHPELSEQNYGALPNGVYLTVITKRASDGRVIMSEVRKRVVVR